MGLTDLSDTSKQQEDLANAKWRPISLVRLGIESEIGTWVTRITDGVTKISWRVVLAEEKLILTATLVWIGADLPAIETLVPQILAHVYKAKSESALTPPEWKF
jgi:hypothetical protein